MKNDEEDVEVNYLAGKDIKMAILSGALINQIKTGRVGTVFLIFSQEMFYYYYFLTFWVF